MTASRGVRRRLKPEERAEIATLYRQGVKLEAIAEQFRVSPSCPRQVAARLGIPPRRYIAGEGWRP